MVKGWYVKYYVLIVLTSTIAAAVFQKFNSSINRSIVIDNGGGIREQEIICMRSPETVLNLHYTRHECIEAPSIPHKQAQHHS